MNKHFRVLILSENMLKLLCIPAYNEEDSIVEVITKSKMWVDKIVVCDDGSNDNTRKVSEMAGAHVISHPKKLGKGKALKTLFDYARELQPDVMITIDGDGQFLPEEIPKLMKQIIENKSDVVIGYRFDNVEEMPLYRKAGNKMLDKVANLAANLPFRDTQSGFRAYSKRAIDLIDFSTQGFGADAEILINASKQKLRIGEEKVTVIYDTGGKTSTKSPISHFVEVISSLIEIIAIKHPLKFLGIPGLILLIIGTIFALIVISIFNDTRYFSIPSTLVAIGSFMIGIILLLMSTVLYSINKIHR